MTKLTLALAVCLSTALPLAAHAGTTLEQSRAAYKSACKADLKKYCANAEKGKNGACLKEHIKDISSECKEARKAYRLVKKQEEPR